MVKKNYVCIPRSFLVINVCNQGKNLCSPCTSEYGKCGGGVATYIGSVMNNSVSNTVVIEFSKRNETGRTCSYWCMFVALFGSRLGLILSNIVFKTTH